MSSLNAIPIQLNVTTRSNPPVPPTDLNTGEWPAIWKGGNYSFNTAIFDTNGVNVDLSNLASLKLSIFPYVTATNYLGYPSDNTYPAIFETEVLSQDFTDSITVSQWVTALSQNVVFEISGNDTENIDLGGQPSARFTLVVSGTIEDSPAPIIYGSGPIFIYESALTRNITPADPMPIAGTQTFVNSSGNTTITLDLGQVLLTSFGTFTGGATVRNIILSTENATDGAKITVVVNFPAITGITVWVRSGSISGTVIPESITVSDGSGQDVTLDFAYSAADEEWRYVVGQYSN